jgi:hypothetical protein
MSSHFILNRFEPVKVDSELYGNTIEFRRDTRQILFTSKFHMPTTIPFSQIEQMTIRYDRKRWLLWLGIITFFLFIGIFLLLIRVHVPPWVLRIDRKNSPTITIRAWLDEEEAVRLNKFTSEFFPTNLQSKSKSSSKM